ncbi:MAG: 3'(2'),5'-bisphosphate nucleotidase CysQ [Bacteroidota bacterium]|nr:3'(2'),5'-bisphosphate nucleotidase CysQ [Bacteroidota bacterium]
MNLNEQLFIAVKAATEAGEAIMQVYHSANFGVEMKSDNSPLTLADKKAHRIIVSYLKTTEIPILSEEGEHEKYSARKNRELFWLVDPLDGTKEFIKKNDEFTVNIALIDVDKPIAGVIYVPVLKQIYIGTPQAGAFKLEDFTTARWSNFRELPDLLNTGRKLPLQKGDRNYTAVGSRSHLSDETLEFMDSLKKKYGQVDIISKGSSLKLCMVAEGKADIYPRFGPTMEWDTGAGDAIVRAMGGSVLKENGEPLKYNKKNLLNPYFIVKK